MKHASIVAAVLVALGMILSAWIVAAALREAGLRIESALGAASSSTSRPPASSVSRTAAAAAWSDLLSLDEPLHSGDVVELTIHELTGPGTATTPTVRLGSSGKVPVPFVGEVGATGLTSVAFEKAVAAALRDANIIANPMVSVTVRRAQ